MSDLFLFLFLLCHAEQAAGGAKKKNKNKNKNKKQKQKGKKRNEKGRESEAAATALAVHPEPEPKAELEVGARRQLAEERAELEATKRRVADERAAFEACVSLQQRRATKARAAMDAERQRLQAERAAFERQQASAAAEERALPVVTAVAVAHAAVAASDEEGAPLQAAEFEHDEGFRVLRRFLSAYHIEHHAPLLREARGRAAPVQLHSEVPRACACCAPTPLMPRAALRSDTATCRGPGADRLRRAAPVRRRRPQGAGLAQGRARQDPGHDA